MVPSPREQAKGVEDGTRFQVEFPEARLYTEDQNCDLVHAGQMFYRCATPGHLFKLSIERQDLSGIAQANLKPGL